MEYIEKRNLILNDEMKKVILVLSAPLMLNNLIQTVYNITDMYFVSEIGDTQVAALAFIWPVIFFIISLGIGVSVAGTALISQYTGADDIENANKVAGQIISFSFLFSIVLGFLGAGFANIIVKTMGGEGLLLEEGTKFLKIVFCGMPTAFLFFAFNSIKQGQGDTITPMKYGALSVILNIILDPIFIFVFKLGMGGAAIATVIARGIFAFYAIYTLFKSNEGVCISREHLYIDLKVLKKVLKIGLPSSIGQSMEAFGFIILNVFIISFGESTLTAFAIGNRINSLLLMPAMGIGSALATVVGQNLGADNIERAKQAVKTGMILATIFLVSSGLILLLFLEDAVRIFTSDPEIVRQGVYYLKLITITQPLVSIFQILVGTFQGSGHTISAMIMLMGRLWLFRIPLIVIFKHFTSLGSNSVWYAMVLSNVFICIVGFCIFMTGKWQKKVIKKEEECMV